VFTGIWAIMKGWMDEKVRRKIQILGKGFINDLKVWVDEDQIPCSLGGTNPANFKDDAGPWKEYDLIDSMEPGAIVGVRRKNDPTGKIFTQKD
jgi:hypothetical protein